MEIIGRYIDGALAVANSSFVWICLSSSTAWAFTMVCCSIAAWILLRKKGREFGN